MKSLFYPLSLLSIFRKITDAIHQKMSKNMSNVFEDTAKN